MPLGFRKIEMRIGINASIVDLFLSGLGTYTVELSRELAKLHGDVILYTAQPEVCAIDAARMRQIRWRVQASQGRMGHLRRLLWTQTVLPYGLLVDRASLLLSPLAEGMFLPTVPQVIVVHDILPLRFPTEYPWQQYYFRYLVPAMLKRARAIVAVSEHTKRDLRLFYGIDAGAIEVVPNGYDRERYRVGLASQEMKVKYDLQSYLLYVGNLLPHKNLQRLLRAFALIAAEVPQLLVIAGHKDPRYHPMLAAEAQALGMAQKVRFLDYVPAADLPALYTGADVFVLPSLYEGFGLPILEAMACGTPVIASHTSAIPEVTGDAAVLIDPQDVPALAASMHAVLVNPEVREALRQRGLARAAQFSWDRTARAVLHILAKAAER
jgi:glycosyltransferase involved in cell wall biosynthesis